MMAFSVKELSVLDIIATLKSCAGYSGQTEAESLPSEHMPSSKLFRLAGTQHYRCCRGRMSSGVHWMCMPVSTATSAVLSAAQWDIMSNLTDTLEPLEEVTLEMSHSESSALCIILSVSETDAGSSAGIKTLWKTMLDTAILQDKGPYKGQCLHFSRDVRESKRMAERSSCTLNEKQKKLWKRLVKQRASKKTDDTPPTLVDSVYAKLLGAAQHTVEAQSSFKTEVVWYLIEPVVECPAFGVVEEKRVRLKRIAALAIKYLCPSPSTVPSEWGFSEVGLNKQRSRLSAENADKLFPPL